MLTPAQRKEHITPSGAVSRWTTCGWSTRVTARVTCRPFANSAKRKAG